MNSVEGRQIFSSTVPMPFFKRAGGSETLRKSTSVGE